jgi:hypothetical protein
MGYLKDRHGFLFLGKTRPGVCSECGRDHAPELPHDCDSLVYQYKFYDEHGRWATWEDAMDHCSDEMKEFWKGELRKRGVKV